MNILRVKDSQGNWIDIPAIVGPKGETGATGPKGDKGDPGVMIVQDGSITKEKLNSELADEISEKASAIFAADDYAYSHLNLRYPKKITFKGNDVAFGNLMVANKRNRMGSASHGTSSHGLTVTRNGRFIVLNGTPTNSSYVEFYQFNFTSNPIPAGTYKYIIKVDKGNSTGAANGTGYFSYTYTDGTSKQVSAKVNPNSTLVETTVEFEQDVKMIRPLIGYHMNNTYENFKMWLGLYPADTEYTDTGFTISDGETLDFENFDHRYDIIDTMQHQSKVESIADTKTYVDNLQIDINEKLTYVTPERFGAVGDNSTDDTTALQACIDYALANNKSVKGFGRYKTTSTIVIDSDDTHIFIRNIRYTGSGPAVKIGGRRNRFEFEAIEATSSNGQGILVFTTTQSHHDTNRTLITGTSINADKECVRFESNSGYYLLYIVMHVKSMISANGDCISTSGNCGEIACYDAWFSCVNGWCFNGLIIKLINCTMESNCWGGVYATQCQIISCRATELMDCIMPGNSKYGLRSGILFKNKASSKVSEGTYIKTTSTVYYESIDLTEVTPINSGSSNASVYNHATGIVDNVIQFGDLNYRYGHFKLGSKMILHGKDKICIPMFENVRRITDTTFDMRDPTPENKPYRLNYPTKFIIESDDCVIWLAPSYCAEGYKDFTVDMSTKMATIYDRRGNLLFDQQNYTNGIYTFHAIVDDTIDDAYQTNHSGQTFYPINSGYCDVWEIKKIS